MKAIGSQIRQMASTSICRLGNGGIGAWPPLIGRPGAVNEFCLILKTGNGVDREVVCYVKEPLRITSEDTNVYECRQEYGWV